MMLRKYCLLVCVFAASACSINGHGLWGERQISRNTTAELVTIKGRGLSLITYQGFQINLGSQESSFIYPLQHSSTNCLDHDFDPLISVDKRKSTDRTPWLVTSENNGLSVQLGLSQIGLNLGVRHRRQLLLPVNRGFVYAYSKNLEQQINLCTYEEYQHD